MSNPLEVFLIELAKTKGQWEFVNKRQIILKDSPCVCPYLWYGDHYGYKASDSLTDVAVKIWNAADGTGSPELRKQILEAVGLEEVQDGEATQQSSTR